MIRDRRNNDIVTIIIAFAVPIFTPYCLSILLVMFARATSGVISGRRAFAGDNPGVVYANNLYTHLTSQDSV